MSDEEPLPDRLVLVPLFEGKAIPGSDDPRFVDDKEPLEDVLRRLRKETVLLYDHRGNQLRRFDFSTYKRAVGVHPSLWLDAGVLVPDDVIDIIFLGFHRVVIDDTWDSGAMAELSRLTEATALRLSTFVNEDGRRSDGSDTYRDTGGAGGRGAYMDEGPGVVISLDAELSFNTTTDKRVYTLGNDIIPYHLLEDD